MGSITETDDTQQVGERGRAFERPADGRNGLAVVALGAAIYLFVELRDARRQIVALRPRWRSWPRRADKRTKELDLGLAAVRGQTAAVAEKAGVTAAELESTAAAARQLREEQRKGQENLASLGGEVGKVKDDVAASKAAIEETQAQLQRAIGDLGEQSGLIARNADELAALKRAGLREYYEFDLAQGQVAVAGRPGGGPPEGRRRQAATSSTWCWWWTTSRSRRRTRRCWSRCSSTARARASSTRSSSSPSRRTGSPAT